MKLLKSNLYNLGESMGIQLPNIENFKFPGLPSDHRRNLVPKESTEEKQLMFKEGDKMRIPGVLDYTGAKYPFKKKIKKGQSGLDTSIFYNYTPYNTVLFGDSASKSIPLYVGKDGNGIPITFDDGHERANPGTITFVKNGEFNVKGNKISKENSNFFGQLLPDEESRRRLYELFDPLKPKYSHRKPENEKSGKRQYFGDNLNNRLDKLKKLIQWSGNPTFNTTDTSRHYGIIPGDREHIDTNNRVYLRGNDYIQIDDIITELSHIFQKNNPYSKELGIDSTLLGMIGGDIKDLKGRTGYERPGHSEFNAHEVLEPAFRDFLFDKKYNTFDDLKKLIEKYYNTKYTLKKGGLLLAKSGIHIKKKNRGKFTDYCGGNVTQECINRAKRSGNKTLVKRAVFAENARKWKH